MVILTAGAVGVILGGIPGGVLAIGVAFAWRRQRSHRAVRPDAVAVAARLLVLVGSGLSLGTALAGAGARGTGDLDDVARRSRRIGLAAALAGADGPLAPLLRRLAEATVSGAPIEPVIRAFLETERRRRHAAAVERARRLPVRLMVPMTLLVLPGFVLMVYGPAVIALVTDLLGPLAP